MKNKREEKIRASILKTMKEMGFNTKQDQNIRVYSIIEFLYMKKAEIASAFKDLNSSRHNSKEYSLIKRLDPACYYGCALLRPKGMLRFDDMEMPTSMEEILEAAGIE